MLLQAEVKGTAKPALDTRGIRPQGHSQGHPDTMQQRQSIYVRSTSEEAGTERSTPSIRVIIATREDVAHITCFWHGCWLARRSSAMCLTSDPYTSGLLGLYPPLGYQEEVKVSISNYSGGYSCYDEAVPKLSFEPRPLSGHC